MSPCPNPHERCQCFPVSSEFEHCKAPVQRLPSHTSVQLLFWPKFCFIVTRSGKLPDRSTYARVFHDPHDMEYRTPPFATTCTHVLLTLVSRIRLPKSTLRHSVLGGISGNFFRSDQMTHRGVESEKAHREDPPAQACLTGPIIPSCYTLVDQCP